MKIFLYLVAAEDTSAPRLLTEGFRLAVSPESLFQHLMHSPSFPTHPLLPCNRLINSTAGLFVAVPEVKCVQDIVHMI